MSDTAIVPAVPAQVSGELTPPSQSGFPTSALSSYLDSAFADIAKLPSGSESAPTTPITVPNTQTIAPTTPTTPTKDVKDGVEVIEVPDDDTQPTEISDLVKQGLEPVEPKVEDKAKDPKPADKEEKPPVVVKDGKRVYNITQSKYERWKATADSMAKAEESLGLKLDDKGIDSLKIARDMAAAHSNFMEDIKTPEGTKDVAKYLMVKSTPEARRALIINLLDFDSNLESEVRTYAGADIVQEQFSKALAKAKADTTDDGKHLANALAWVADEFGIKLDSLPEYKPAARKSADFIRAEKAEAELDALKKGSNKSNTESIIKATDTAIHTDLLAAVDAIIPKFSPELDTNSSLTTLKESVKLGIIKELQSMLRLDPQLKQVYLTERSKIESGKVVNGDAITRAYKDAVTKILTGSVSNPKSPIYDLVRTKILAHNGERLSKTQTRAATAAGVAAPKPNGQTPAPAAGIDFTPKPGERQEDTVRRILSEAGL